MAPSFIYSQLLAQYDYQLLVYMDDILLVSYMDNKRTSALLALLRELFDLFGIQVNCSKSVLAPVSRLEYLGLILDIDGTIALAPRCLAKLRAHAT